MVHVCVQMLFVEHKCGRCDVRNVDLNASVSFQEMSMSQMAKPRPTFPSECTATNVDKNTETAIVYAEPRKTKRMERAVYRITDIFSGCIIVGLDFSIQLRWRESHSFSPPGDDNEDSGDEHTQSTKSHSKPVSVP